ncbi:ABC transporter permease [Streptomyces sp. SID3343]|uniref:ABC transporter permease n=1 Tax=Streptomyces sp. SID3343 TaxID=2690260 RepID=UPI00136ADCB5|nr:ABC transporter permease [Streptomyces sp. SID3343]MYW03733.1 ABC transporter permease [Streptomyces sp. SID3343]
MSIRHALSDTRTLATRILLYYRHSPALVLVSLIVPVALVLVFGYVFGSAIDVPGDNYREYLMPGLFALVAMNTVMPTMVGTARDIGLGVTDRLRSMPVSRPGLLLGQAVADAVVGVVVLIAVTGLGLAVGWRVRDGATDALAAFALLVLFRFVMTWVGIHLGLLAGREDVAGQLGVLVLPIAMVTNAFVPTEGMPAWLRAIADWNPISALVAACRTLFGNPTPPTAHAALPLQHPVAATLIWSAALLAIFVPLSIRRFDTHGR